jgi:hypothetical protein
MNSIMRFTRAAIPYLISVIAFANVGLAAATGSNLQAAKCQLFCDGETPPVCMVPSRVECCRTATVSTILILGIELG